jgi:hypothetical protein
MVPIVPFPASPSNPPQPVPSPDTLLEKLDALTQERNATILELAYSILARASITRLTDIEAIKQQVAQEFIHHTPSSEAIAARVRGLASLFLYEGARQ